MNLGDMFDREPTDVYETEYGTWIYEWEDENPRRRSSLEIGKTKHNMYLTIEATEKEEKTIYYLYGVNPDFSGAIRLINKHFPKLSTPEP